MTFWISQDKVKWLHLTGEIDKSVTSSCLIFSEFNIPKIIKISQFLIELFKKVDVLGGHRIVPESKNNHRLDLLLLPLRGGHCFCHSSIFTAKPSLNPKH